MLSLWIHSQGGWLFSLTNYLGEHLLKIPLIARQHSFQFLRTGEVIICEYSNSPETKLNLLKDSTWRPAYTALPPIILSSGLSSECQGYLFEKIREYYSAQTVRLGVSSPNQYPSVISTFNTT